MSEVDILMCANCGKSDSSLKSCAACMLVKYCSRDCQIAHRPQHKKACKKRAAELYDEALFKQPPPPEDCPICMLPLPDDRHVTFESCCGKEICNGCIYSMFEREGTMTPCAFCRTPHATSEEQEVERLKKMVEKGNPQAMNNFAAMYADGYSILPQDWAQANNLYLKAGELGYSGAYYNLGQAYYQGLGIELDEKKANHYFELAAMNGHVEARHNLGCLELEDGNNQRAFKHFLIAARSGYKQSLDVVKQGFMKGDVTKEEYANTLREYQNIRDNMKSDARDKALAHGSTHPDDFY